MHPAEREGAHAGRAAAIEDTALGEQIGANVIIMASTAAAEWLADNPRFADATGESRHTYIAAYLASYHRELRGAADDRER